MKFYECIFIIKQELSPQEVHELVDKYKIFIQKAHGKVIKREYWGLRRLAYEIEKNKKGHYIFFGLYTSHSIIKKIENHFNISEEILKFLTIKITQISKEPTLMIQALNKTKS